jgi:Tfp pilus assembly protein PilN
MSRANEMHGFLPDDYVELKTQRRTNLLWALIFLIVAGGIGWAYMIAEEKIRNAEEENRAVNAEFAAAAGTIEQFKQMQAEQRRLNQKAQLVGSLLEPVKRSNILAELTNSLPPRVYLKEVDLRGTRQTETAAAGARTSYERARAPAAPQQQVKPVVFNVRITIKGLAFTVDDVTTYRANLERSALFGEAHFIEAREGTYRDRKLYEFQLEVLVDPTANSRPVEQVAIEGK